MNNAEMISAYKALKAEEKALKQKIEALGLEIQAAMVAADVWELIESTGKASLTQTTTTTFDAAGFRRDHPELAARYTGTRSGTRFVIR